jgi:hypothetical protein
MDDLVKRWMVLTKFRQLIDTWGAAKVPPLVRFHHWFEDENVQTQATAIMPW